MILNEITHKNNNILEDDRNKTANFHGMDRIMEEDMSIFQSMVKAEQYNDRTQKNRPLAENDKPASSSNEEQGTEKATKRLE